MRYGALAALSDIDLHVAAGERVAVVGPSGAGKSTLLGLFNGTVAPTAGRVEVLGVDLASVRGRDLRAVQRRVGAIRQQFDLVGSLRVVHNVNAGRLGQWSLLKAAASLVSPSDTAPVAGALRRVGVEDKIHERVDRLSGGQQQRVALARVLVQDPSVILADEPIASLDPVRGREVMDLLRDLAVELGKTLVASVHAFEYALTHFDRVIGLRDGRVLVDSPANEVGPDIARDLYAIEGAVTDG